MLCKECKKRDRCEEACEELINHLEGFTYPQHDEIIDPLMLEEMLLPGAKIQEEEEADHPVRLNLRKAGRNPGAEGKGHNNHILLGRQEYSRFGPGF